MSASSVPNYVEYILGSKVDPTDGTTDGTTDGNIFRVGLLQNHFEKAFEHVTKVKHLRYVQYYVRETHINNLLVRYGIEENKQKNEHIKQNVYIMNLLERHIIVDASSTGLPMVQRVVYERNSVPSHHVPSSNQIFRDLFIQYASVRVSKNVFLNFEKQYLPCDILSNIENSPGDMPCTYSIKVVVWNYPVTSEQENDIQRLMRELRESIFESEPTICM